jgi:hypothetical protein
MIEIGKAGRRDRHRQGETPKLRRGAVDKPQTPIAIDPAPDNTVAGFRGLCSSGWRKNVRGFLSRICSRYSIGPKDIGSA